MNNINYVSLTDVYLDKGSTLVYEIDKATLLSLTEAASTYTILDMNYYARNKELLHFRGVVTSFSTYAPAYAFDVVHDPCPDDYFQCYCPESLVLIQFQIRSY